MQAPAISHAGPAHLGIGVPRGGGGLELAQSARQVAWHALPRQQPVPQLALRLGVTPAQHHVTEQRRIGQGSSVNG